MIRRFEVQLDLRTNPNFMRTHRRFLTVGGAKRFANKMIKSTTQFSVYVYDRKTELFLVSHI